MIETKVPKDIRKYKTKAVGHFTIRQIVCISICIVADLLLYICVFKPFNLNIRWIIYAIIGVDIPIMAFTFEPRGMKMEKYIKNILIRMLFSPTYRKPKNIIIEETTMEPTPKSKLKKKQKENPTLKPYK